MSKLCYELLSRILIELVEEEIGENYEGVIYWTI